DVEQRHEKGQPILIGTTNVEVSEQISKILKKKRIRHEILNAKNHFKEAEIIFKAGEKGAITIATNMAGRGTDIRLGQGVKELGGLAVLGTERHESRRIDNQLRGRAGRQGDPGFSRFFVSGEDDLVKRFGGNKIQKLIIFLNKSKEDKKNISSKIFTNFFTNLQKKIESSNFEQRKFVLQFDSVLGLQREIIYKQRRNVLTSSNIESLALILINKTLDGQIENFLNSTINKQKEQYLKKIIDYLENLFFTKQTFILEDFEKIKNFSYSLFKEKIKEIVRDKVKYIFDKRKEKLTLDKQNYYFGILKNIILHNIDNHFKNHIYDMSILRKSINFVSYGQQNSLVIYQNEGQILFNKMIENIALDITSIILKSYLLNNQLHESFIEENHQTLFKFSRLDKQKQNSKKYKKVSYKKKPWD
ncbi:helicase domain protein, partial [Candidatus Phytoplasma oryzae]